MDFQPRKTNKGSDAANGALAIFADGAESVASGSATNKTPSTEILTPLRRTHRAIRSAMMRGLGFSFLSMPICYPPFFETQFGNVRIRQGVGV